MRRLILNIGASMFCGTFALAQQQSPSPEQITELRAKAKKGDAEAQYHLGVQCLEAPHKLRNPEDGEKWLRKAAAQGHAKAQYALAGLIINNSILTGRGGGNVEEGIEWLRKSAAQGDAEAQSGLGFMYLLDLTRHGLPKDEVEAYEWALLASAQANKEATKRCKDLERTLIPKQRAGGERRAREFKPTPAK